MYQNQGSCIWQGKWSEQSQVIDEKVEQVDEFVNFDEYLLKWECGWKNVKAY